MSRRPFLLLAGLFAAILAACVPVDQLPAGSVPGAGTSGLGAQAFGDLDAGAQSTPGLHFTVKGYTDTEIRPVMSMAENLLNKILNDSGLYAAMSSSNFKIVLYRDREEYAGKTHQSTMRVVTSSGTIYAYPGPDLEAPMMHALAHVVIQSYLGAQVTSFRWVDEGFAMYEEFSKMAESDRSSFRSNQVNVLRGGRVPFSQMTFFTPSGEDQRMTDPWFAQSESVVAYLLAQGSTLNFGSFLGDLKQGADIDRALLNNYPTRFRTFGDLETAWKSTI